MSSEKKTEVTEKKMSGESSEAFYKDKIKKLNKDIANDEIEIRLFWDKTVDSYKKLSLDENYKTITDYDNYSVDASIALKKVYDDSKGATFESSGVLGRARRKLTPGKRKKDSASMQGGGALSKLAEKGLSKTKKGLSKTEKGILKMRKRNKSSSRDIGTTLKQGVGLVLGSQAFEAGVNVASGQKANVSLFSLMGNLISGATSFVSAHPALSFIGIAPLIYKGYKDYASDIKDYEYTHVFKPAKFAEIDIALMSKRYFELKPEFYHDYDKGVFYLHRLFLDWMETNKSASEQKKDIQKKYFIRYLTKANSMSSSILFDLDADVNDIFNMSLPELEKLVKTPKGDKYIEEVKKLIKNEDVTAPLELSENNLLQNKYDEYFQRIKGVAEGIDLTISEATTGLSSFQAVRSQLSSAISKIESDKNFRNVSSSRYGSYNEPSGRTRDDLEYDRRKLSSILKDFDAFVNEQPKSKKIVLDRIKKHFKTEISKVKEVPDIKYGNLPKVLKNTPNMLKEWKKHIGIEEVNKKLNLDETEITSYENITVGQTGYKLQDNNSSSSIKIYKIDLKSEKLIKYREFLKEQFDLEEDNTYYVAVFPDGRGFVFQEGDTSGTGVINLTPLSKDSSTHEEFKNIGNKSVVFMNYLDFLFYYCTLEILNTQRSDKLAQIYEILENNPFYGESIASFSNKAKQLISRVGIGEEYVQWLNDRNLGKLIPILETRRVRGTMSVLKSLSTLKEPGRSEIYKYVIQGLDKITKSNLDSAITEAGEMFKDKDEKKKQKKDEKTKKKQEKKKILEERRKERLKKKELDRDKKAKESSRPTDSSRPSDSSRPTDSSRPSEVETEEIKKVSDGIGEAKKEAKKEPEKSVSILDRITSLFSGVKVEDDKSIEPGSYIPPDKTARSLVKVTQQEITELRKKEQQLTRELKKDKLTMDQYRLFLNKQLTQKMKELDYKKQNMDKSMLEEKATIDYLKSKLNEEVNKKMKLLEEKQRVLERKRLKDKQEFDELRDTYVDKLNKEFKNEYKRMKHAYDVKLRKQRRVLLEHLQGYSGDNHYIKELLESLEQQVTEPVMFQKSKVRTKRKARKKFKKPERGVYAVMEVVA